MGVLAWLFTFLATVSLVSSRPDPDVITVVTKTVDHVASGLVSDQLMPVVSIKHGIARRKRQTDDDDDDDDTMCAAICALRLQAASRRYQQFVGRSEFFGDSQMIKPNLTVATEMCNALRPSLRCFQQCRSSSLTEEINSALDPLRYLCIDRFEDLTANYQCMANTGNVTIAQCKPKCLQHENAVDRLKQFSQRPNLHFLFSMDEIRDMMDGACQFVKCNIDCSDQIVRRACGNTAANVIKGFLQKMMAFASKKAEEIGLWPESCRRVSQAEK